MSSNNLKKPHVATSCGKKSLLTKVALNQILPATTASRKDIGVASSTTSNKLSSSSDVVITNARGIQREAAKLREDEGATAIKRRKVDN